MRAIARAKSSTGGGPLPLRQRVAGEGPLRAGAQEERAPELTDRPLTGRYRTVVGGTPARGRTLARADVAHAMPAVLADPSTVRRGVGVAS
ncbi:NAD(P)-dependent oxidoreductase [Streptomyces roseolus]|uniref:hypothetical protein n=1 Tax=Streptomyces roseolus TaxID=67358 RepID=UPI00365F5692